MTPYSRRHFLQANLALAGLGLAVAGCGVLPPQAQQPEKVHRIGFVGVTAAQSRVDPFREGLGQYGYVEGRNITVEYRWAEIPNRVVDPVAELAQLPVEVIVAAGGAVTGIAWQASQTVPIVGVNIPVGSTYAASLARPGGNVTGLSALSVELSAKRLQLLKDSVPATTRVAVLWSGNRVSASGEGASDLLREWEATQAAAQALGLQVQSLELRSFDRNIEAMFEAALRGGAQALVVLPDAAFDPHRAEVVDLAARSRLPAIYSQRDFIDAGGLMTYGPSFPALYRRAAYYVDKILKGAKPADLPIEQPTRFEFVINLTTAQALGLTIPQSVLLQATEVIQ